MVNLKETVFYFENFYRICLQVLRKTMKYVSKERHSKYASAAPSTRQWLLVGISVTMKLYKDDTSTTRESHKVTGSFKTSTFNVTIQKRN
jgi:hypothetical protein